MLIFVCHLDFFCNCSNTKSKRNGYKMSVVGGKFGFPLGFLDGDRCCGEKSKSKRNQGRTQNGFEEWCGVDVVWLRLNVVVGFRLGFR
jgi:hypothetical protein